MAMTERMNRRSFLARSMSRGAIIGCSAAASPLFTPVTLASAPWDNRLVVIILRGAMDGLDVVQPYGGRNWAGLRPGAAAVGGKGGATDLDGFFALHPALAPLLPMWAQGELGFVHAVSTPYRDKRSHFDGQDMLEAGTAAAGEPIRDGWLNRMLQAVPGVEAETAFAVGRSDMLLTRGAAPVADWSPDAGLHGMSPQSLRLLEQVVHDDPMIAAALSEAMDLSREPGMAGDPDRAAMAAEVEDGDMARMMVQDMQARAKAGGHMKIAEFAGQRLREETRIASFSVNGWDTHANQARTLVPPLTRLAEMIVTLKDTVGGPVWGKTAVVAMTEFGRTARVNGTGGTDHGTGGVMLLAGGALRGGRVAGRWPGLAEADLYARRDLMPTSDVRAHTAWMMRGLFGLERSVLQKAVFPGLDMGEDPGLLR